MVRRRTTEDAANKAFGKPQVSDNHTDKDIDSPEIVCISLRLPANVHQKIKDEAWQQHKSLNQHIIDKLKK